MRAYCKECMHFRYCLERTRDIPCASYKERRRQDGRHKRTDSPRTGCALERTPGTTPGAEEKELSAAAGTGHEPGPAGYHLHHGSGDLHSAGGTDVKGVNEMARIMREGEFNSFYETVKKNWHTWSLGDQSGLR